MKIPATLQPLLDARPRAIPSLLQQLKIGQLLPAKVLEQVQPGMLRLQMANTILLARSQVALEPGTRLTLEVTKPYPLPELRVLRLLTREEIRQQVVRTSLPRQLTPVEVRRATTTLADRADAGRMREPLRQLAAIQRDAGVKIPQLSSAQIRRAVTHSGLLHEARLTTGTPPETGDGKLRLLQLLVELRPLLAPEEVRRDPRAPKDDTGQHRPQRAATADSLVLRLIRLIEGSVARIQLQQAAALPQDDGQRQAWQLDLPMHLGDETQDAMLRIEREPSQSSDETDSTWAVNLAFEFDSIGRLQCRIALTGDRVSVTFWCEQTDTQRRVEHRLPSLQEAFEAQGFEVVHLAGVVGDPPEPLIALPIADALLDERA